MKMLFSMTRSLAILATASISYAQTPSTDDAARTFPSGTVRLIVPYPPGGGVDGLARPLAERLSKTWSQPVIVENRAGAATIIGTGHVVGSPPDGLTVLMTTDSTVTSNPHLYAKLPFDPMTALVPVTQLIDLYQMVVVHPSVTATTMKELVGQAKARPEPWAYGSYGAGSQPHLLYEALKRETGIPLTHVPFQGIAPAIQATLGGHVQMTLGGAATTGGYFSAGRMKPLAIAAPRRIPQFPDVPTLTEAGFPDVGPKSWFGLFVPRGTPPAIVERIARDVREVLSDPAFDKAQVTGKGYHRVGNTPAEFADMIRQDHAQKGRIIGQIGIKLD